MPRKIIPRKVVVPPKFKGYKPYGNHKVNGFIELLYEEYEAIKLSDYDMLTHKEAGDVMGISRATFARIYEKGRRKIAEAFVENKEIITVYGNVFFDNNQYKCNSCSAVFNITTTSKKDICPVCKSTEIEKY